MSDFLSNCTLSSSTGRVSCPDVTRRGLTISRSFAFTDAAGNPQAAPNSSTNTINDQVTVSGTVTRHDGNVTSTVQHTSERTVSGKDPVTSSRKEVVTYDGSATAKVVITKNGTTKNCTLPLPFGRLNCS